MNNAVDKPVVTLLPCPFCGSDELSHGWDRPGWDGREETGNVQCGNCDAFILHDSEAEAITAWNTRHREQDTLSREGREADPFAAITEEVRELVEDEEAGFWRPCTGCHETDEGHPTGRFPFSRALNCELGHGCRECGGIGAVWDDTDYADMAEFMAAADRDHENIKRILIENGVQPYPAEMMTMEIRALEIPAALSHPAREGRDVGREALAARLLKNAEWRDERSQCVTDPNLLREAAEALSGGAATAPIASIVVKLSAIRTALREAHWALDDSEDLSHQDPPVHAVPLENVMRLHRALKACERFAPDDAAWEGPGPLVTEIIEWLGASAALSTAPASTEQADQADVLRERIEEMEVALEPFATFADTFIDEEGWSGPMKAERIVDWFGPSDFRKARAALTAAIGEPSEFSGWVEVVEEDRA